MQMTVGDDRLFIGDRTAAFARRFDGADQIVDGRHRAGIVIAVDVDQRLVDLNPAAAADDLGERLVVVEHQPGLAEDQITVGNPVEDVLRRNRRDVEEIQLLNRDAVEDDREHKADRCRSDRQVQNFERCEHTDD